MSDLSFPSVPAFDYDREAQTKSRVGKKDILPGSIQLRHLASDFVHTDAANLVYGSSISAGNGSTTIFTFTMKTTNDATILAIPDVTIYQGSIAAGNEVPDVNPSKYVYATRINDWGATDNIDAVAKFIIYNNTGFSQTLIFRGRVRYVASEASGGGATS